MYLCVASISELTKPVLKNSTLTLFETFAQKIIDANLPQADINRIEAWIMFVQYEETATCYN